MHDLPLPRLLDHMGAEDGPSEPEEEEKEAKRQRSASTTPRSTSGTLPHEYDMVMGIAPAESQESERFEEGNDSDFQDAEETTAQSREPPEVHNNPITETIGSGEFYGGYGNSSLRECIEIASQQNATPATLHSKEGLGNMTNPPQVMSPNVERNQSQETTSVKQQPPDDTSLRPTKR